MAKVFSVSNADDLMSALASANGGDTIELAGGDYGAFSLWDGRQEFIKYDAPVTITSADPNDQATFSELRISGAKNITFDNIAFDYQFSIEDPRWHRPFQVNNSDDIVIKNSTFVGDVADGISEIKDGLGYAFGLSVKNSTNIHIEGNEFTTWDRGAIFDNVDDLIVSDNNFHGLSGDGMNFVSVRSVLIENNHLHNFSDHVDSTSHRDFIQFWTNGTDQPSTNIVIRGNILDIGEGSWTQSIFMRNEEVDRGLAGEEMFYKNILIEDNIIHNGHLHGITVGETDGLTIRNNSVLHAEGEMHGLEGAVTIPRINVKTASTSVVIEGNITSDITGYKGQPDWTVDGNAIIQPGDYFGAFVTSSLQPVAGTHNFIALPGGWIENLQAGAARTHFDVAPDTLTPLFQIYSDASSSNTLILDASLTVGPFGLVSESDADFLWNFGNGNTASGRIAKHDFTPGHHDVTLTVVAKDGTTAQAHFTAGIAGDDILRFDAQAGLFENLVYGEEKPSDSGTLPLVKAADSYALKLGGEGTQASVPRSELSHFFGTDSFEMSMSLKADSAASWGEVARIHTSFTANVDQRGNFQITLFTDDGSRVRVATEGIVLNDGSTHDVTVRFDGKAGFAEILIDGVVVASESVSGSLGGGPRSLDFGNPWGSQNFEGELSAFALSAVSRDFPIYDGAALPVSDTETGMTEEGSPPHEPLETEDEAAPTPVDPEPAPEIEEDANLLPNPTHGTEPSDQKAPSKEATIKLDNAVKLGEAGIRESISRGDLSELFSQTEVGIGFSIKSDMAGKTGEVFRLHESFVVSVNRMGEVHVRAWSSEGDYVSLSSGPENMVNDGKRYDVGIQLSEGLLSLWVNGESVAHSSFDGTFQDRGRHDLTFGNPWHGKERFFDGELSDFSVGLVNAAPSMTDTPVESGLIADATIAPEPKQEVTIKLDDAVTLGEAGIRESISRGDLSELFSQTDVEISFTIGADMAGKTGEVFRLHESFVVSVNRMGEVHVRAWSSEGDYVSLGSGPENMVNDGKRYEVDIQLSQGLLSLWVNGESVAHSSFDGTFQDRGRHDLTFGNPWHGKERFFDGELSDFSVGFAPVNAVVGVADPFAAFTGLQDIPLM